MYDAVLDIPHADPITKDKKDGTTPTEDGMKRYFEAVRKAIDQEAPLKAGEAFDRIFYDASVWRAPMNGCKPTWSAESAR